MSHTPSPTDFRRSYEHRIPHFQTRLPSCQPHRRPYQAGDSSYAAFRDPYQADDPSYAAFRGPYPAG